MFTVRHLESALLLDIIRFVIIVWATDWEKVKDPDWNKEKTAKFLEVIIEVLLLFERVVT